MGGAICLAQMIGLPIVTWKRLLIWLVGGLVVYFIYGRRHGLASGSRRLAVDLAIHPDAT
jgi:hypothetical protein